MMAFLCVRGKGEKKDLLMTSIILHLIQWEKLVLAVISVTIFMEHGVLKSFIVRPTSNECIPFP